MFKNRISIILVVIAVVLLTTTYNILTTFAAPTIGDTNTKATLGNDIIGGSKYIYNVSGVSIGTTTTSTASLVFGANGQIKFADGTTQSTAPGASDVSAAQISPGIFGSVVGKGNYTFQKGSNTNPVFMIDATNGRIMIGSSTVSAPRSLLDIATGTINALVVSDDGNVGIGTTAPVTQLNLNGAGQTTAAITDSGAVGGTLLLNDSGGLVGNGGTLLFGGLAANVKWFAGIKGLISDGTTNSVGDLAFSTRNAVADTALTERMRITKDGNVGIGTTDFTNMANPLRLTATSTGITGLTVENLNTAGAAGILFNINDMNRGQIDVDNNKLLTLKTLNAAGSAWNTGIVLDTNGNVGIGTVAPASNQGFPFAMELSDSGATAGWDLMLTNPTAGTNEFLGQLSWNHADDALASIVGKTDGATDAGHLEFQTQATGGAIKEQMRITSTGNVGIGTTAPAQKLSVVGNIYASGDITADGSISANVNAAQVAPGVFGSTVGKGNYTFQAATGTNAILYVDATGNERVGIGTTAPVTQLNLNGAGQTTAAITDSGAVGGTLLLNDSGGLVGNGGTLLFGGLAANVKWFAGIKGLISDGTTNSVGDLAFSTRNAVADTALTERMRITKDGNVGIGTTGPNVKLHVLTSGTAVNPGADYVGVFQRNANTTDNAFVSIVAGNAASSLLTFGDAQDPENGSLQYVHSDNSLRFNVNAGEKMRITSTGNVGIWTTTPANKLTIQEAGTVTASVQNTASTAGTYARYEVMNDNGGNAYSDWIAYSSGSTGTLFGQTTANYSIMYSAGALSNGFILGAYTADPLIFGTNNAERMRIDNSGNVGIGTTMPAVKLALDSGAAGTANYMSFGQGGEKTWIGSETNASRSFIVYDKASSTYRMAIDKGGNVGIGTVTPTTKAHIIGSALTIGDESTYGVSISEAGDETERLILGYDKATGYGIVAAIDDGVAWKGLLLNPNGGNIGIGTTTPSYPLDISSANTGGTALQLANTSAGGGKWQIVSTGSGNSSGANDFGIYGVTLGNFAMLIQNSGNVGIGTTTPAVKVDIWGTSPIIRAASLTTSQYAEFQADNHTNALQIGVENTAGGRMGGTLANGVYVGSYGNYGMTFHTNNLNRMTITNAGNVGIGTTAPGAKLDVTTATAGQTGIRGENSGATGDGVYGSGPSRGVYGSGGLYGVYGSGSSYGVYGFASSTTGVGVYANNANAGASSYGLFCFSGQVNGCGGNRAWFNSSDERLKMNIKTIDNALSKVQQLRGVNFEWISNPGQNDMGFVAQEVIKVVPEIVGKGKDDYYSIRQSELTALLVEAVKEQQEQINDLKSEIETLKK